MRALFPKIESPSSVTLNDISVTRGNKHLFAGLTLSVSHGEVLWIQGDNGIGKTTLLRVAAGFSTPTQGNVSWRKGQVASAPSDVVAYQGHVDAFKPTLKTSEEINFWANIFDTENNVLSALEYVDLSAKQDVPIGGLSAGQKRRLALARLILSQKPIWIMDEPLAAMDAAGTGLMERAIAAHIARGGAAMIASHSAAKSLGGQSRRLIMRSPT